MASQVHINSLNLSLKILNLGLKILNLGLKTTPLLDIAPTLDMNEKLLIGT